MTPQRPTPLAEAVGRFLHGSKVEGMDQGTATDDAARVVVGVLAPDGRLSPRERDAVAAAFPGRHLPAGPHGPGLGTFERLAGRDVADGGQRAWRYYADAMALAHAAVALSPVPRAAQLAAVDGLRDDMLRVIAQLGIRRPAPRELTGVLDPDVARWVPWRRGPSAGPPAVVDLHGRRADDAERGARRPSPGAAPEPSRPRPVGEVLADLDALIGLDPVKTQVRRVTDLATVHRLRRDRGLPVPPTTHHLVFTGNPGTGKTTVARLVAEIYAGLGVVERGQLIETDRSGLVVGYVGQTATRVREVVHTALGGVLLIDEAYALARGGERDFGREAIDTLVKLMEDHRDELVVIVAGYPDEMAGLIDSNPGLASRFPRTITFPDYDDDELVSILVQIARQHAYELDDEARAQAQHWFAAQPRGPGFGNGRLARNLFEEATARQATRLVADGRSREEGGPSAEQLTTLTGADLPAPGDRLAVEDLPQPDH